MSNEVGFGGRRGTPFVLAALFVGIFLFGLLPFMAGCDGSDSDFGEGVLAVANGEYITVDEYRMSAGGDVPDEMPAKNELLGKIINRKLVLQKARAEGFDASKELFSVMENFYTDRLPGVLVSRMAQDIVVPDDELEFYRPDLSTVLKVTMLVAKDEETAEVAREELSSGTDFDKVVEDHKDNMASKVKMEREVRLDDDTYPAGVRATLNSMAPGGLSPVTKMEIGYVVFRLDGRMDPDALWNMRKEHIRADLKAKKVDAAVKELSDELWKNSNIIINDTPDGPVAMVDGVIITTDKFKVTEATETSHGSPHGGMNVETSRAAINKMVKNYLLAKEATRRGLEEDPEVKKKLALESEKIIADTYLDKMSEGITASPEEISEYYEQNKAKYTLKPGLRISRMLFKDEGKAKSVLKMVREGGDFAELAKKYSEDKSTSSLGGDVGFLDPAVLVEPVKSAVESLEPGESAGPVKSAYGYELLKVTETRGDDSYVPLSDVEASISRRVVLNKRAEMVEDMYAKLYEKADVKVNRKLLDSLK